MAAEIGVSSTHLSRLFRAYKGVAPIQFVVNTRLEIARSFLEMTPMTIAQIADELGYHDTFAFSHQFKKHTGKSPSQWRSEAGQEAT